ncbi:hypothetical protein E2C01_086022 [Portunus trituberculatus]|uniref:Uncharacterized protein n=1 Tax=Portunus trituberculatus TaxID=210409 RepID=A0A5B7JF83_PORTR|nr:hypothetical protein [Portunus trituberculatus]
MVWVGVGGLVSTTTTYLPTHLPTHPPFHFSNPSPLMYPTHQIYKTSTLLTEETLRKTLLVISVALENSRGERKERFIIRVHVPSIPPSFLGTEAQWNRKYFIVT